MNLKFLTILLAAVSINAAAQTPEQQITRFYPTFSKKMGCHIANDKKQGTYCMKPVLQKIVDTPHGRQLLAVWAGSHVDLRTGMKDGAHVHSGLAGIFLFIRQGSGWKLAASSAQERIGAYGNPPQQWSVHEFGAGKWGILSSNADAHQGFAGRHYVVFVPVGKKITAGWIGRSYSNEGAYGDCSDYEVATERRQCLAKLKDLEASVKIRRDLTADGGFYPLEMTVNGYAGKKKWHNQNYLIRFNPAKSTYTVPKNYPLADIEY